MATKDPRRSNGNAEQGRDREVPPFQKFEGFVKKIAAIPKEELDEQRAKHERERKEKRAG